MEYQSQQVDKIFPALIAVQSELNNPSKDKQGHGYKYADLAQIINLSREPLKEHGLAVTQICGVVDGQSYLITQMIHSSGQWIRGYYPLEKAGMRSANDAQQMGAAMTYARRYNLAAILGVAQEDDDAASVPVNRNKQSPAQKPTLNKVEGQTLNAVTQWLAEGLAVEHVIERLSSKYAVQQSAADQIRTMAAG